ncbi:phytoene desaturase family protein [Brevundimonas staleyi]|uniref:Phytoene desaturase family protein n=1 Tax=Brevundimonas staleyi TaxID=74326 RepID=A0ABW0FM51_9CAUL
MSYDAIIIGAGIGGLSAAALLAHAGKQVLLLERADEVGGRTRSKTIEGFRIPLGATAIQLDGIIPEICRTVGAEMNVVEVSRTYFWVDGKIHELPAKGSLAKMLELFAQAGGKDQTKVMSRMALEMAGAKAMQALAGDTQRDSWDDSVSFRDWLLRHTNNPAILELFHAITSSMSGVNDFEYPVKHWFAWASSKAMAGRFDKYGMGPEGFAAISRSLGDAFMRLGGELVLNADVQLIEVENGRAVGVVYAVDGQTHNARADWVVSNAGPKETLALTGEQQMEPAYVERLQTRVRSAPIVVTAVATPFEPMDTSGMVVAAGLNRVVSFGWLTKIAPNLAPPGWHLTTFYGTPGSCIGPMDIEEETRLNVEDASTVIPDLEARGGRILDVHCRNPDDPFALYKSWPGYDMPVETPIPNLFNVGDGVKPLGFIGTPAAALSAKMVVEQIL